MRPGKPETTEQIDAPKIASYIRNYLKRLETAIPPTPGCHHSLTAVQYGNSEVGWKDELCLGIRRNGKTENYFIDDEDLCKSPEDLAKFILSGLCSETPQRKHDRGQR